MLAIKECVFCCCWIKCSIYVCYVHFVYYCCSNSTLPCWFSLISIIDSDCSSVGQGHCPGVSARWDLSLYIFHHWAGSLAGFPARARPRTLQHLGRAQCWIWLLSGLVGWALCLGSTIGWAPRLLRVRAQGPWLWGAKGKAQHLGGTAGGAPCPGSL